MGRSANNRSPLFSLLLLAGSILLLCAGWWAAAKVLGASLLVIGLFIACAFLAAASYRQHTLLRERSAELRDQTLALHAAINNITQALLMFDSEGRLVLCNDRYRHMYGLSAERVLPGASLRSLLAYRKQLGNFPDDPEQYCRDILADLATGKTSSKTWELGDGRVVSIVNQPLPGGGWVSTHQDITELHRAQKDAQQSHDRLAAVIDAMPAGLIFYDDRDRLVLSNQYYTHMHAATADVRVKGARFEAILRAAVAREITDETKVDAEGWIAARLAAHAAPYDLSEHRYKDGRWLRVQTLRTADGGSIGIHIDITELKRREQELNVQNMRFEAALQNMSQGLAMFDRDRKLVICNERFAQLYDLPPELVTPGTGVEDILSYRVASGNICPERADFVQSRMEHVLKGESSDSIVELTDGRLVAVGHRPMADGGWVSTHEDVTERRRSEDRIAHLARHDTLTGLPNRMLFREYMERALTRVRRGEMLALHCIDLDQFKGINDALGHVAGDALLMQVAARIRRLRAGDGSDCALRRR